ncbi:MAG TPA: hypothetical protein VLD67_17945 [Vicinamibacterales bacterium]|nr:hypothetical protein [Vicinamibacterales bacterium]
MTGLLAAGVALAIVTAIALRALLRRATRRGVEPGSVSQRWLAVHRTEN